MGIRGERVRELKEKFDPAVIQRDGNRCFVCGFRANDVHEIVSKSQFSTAELEHCITPKNMVSLCREHHIMVQGNKQASASLLRALEKMYNYEYTDYPFSWYISEE
jgi:5-methylcytosine-specific restriction endonuclease McrA